MNAGHRRRMRAAYKPHRQPHRRRRHPNAPRRCHSRHNASKGGGGIFSSVTHIGVSLAAAFGSKILTQVVLGASNTGIAGYFGNGVATAAMAMVAKMFGYAKYVNSIIAGGAIQIAIRAASDFTPYGTVLAQTGLGDYQVSNWVTPQRYVDPLNSAMVEIPNGWGPGMVAAAPGSKALVKAGMAGTMDYDGLYGATGGGLYS